MVGKKGVKKASKRNADLETLERQLSKLNTSEMKELLLMNMYKLALVRSQLDAVTDVLVKKKLVTREKLWKETRECFSGPEL